MRLACGASEDAAIAFLMSLSAAAGDAHAVDGCKIVPFSMSKRKSRLTVSLCESGIRDRILFLGGGDTGTAFAVSLEVP